MPPQKKAAKKAARKKAKPMDFHHKLVLNQWMLTLFKIDPLSENYQGKKKPFHALAAPISDPRHEGLDQDNIHHFHHQLVKSELFWDHFHEDLSEETLLRYEQLIVSHTQTINERRATPITWKYYQWLNLLFVEIYLDWFFSKPEKLLWELNSYLARFNKHYSEQADVPPFTPDDLRRICIQNATGSGKTLIMHLNILQFRHYSEVNGQQDQINNIILVTPNERLSQQHITDFDESNFPLVGRLQPGQNGGLGQIDVIEITKLAEKDSQNEIATRSLGRNNLLLVDEGHRGTSGGRADAKWYSRRQQLSESGFTFEYSATFKQAVVNTDLEDPYAKSVLFDYSYRWFYEDGFGKDYKITNLPRPKQEVVTKLRKEGKGEKADQLAQKQLAGEATLPYYLTAALLRFYQQSLLYKENEVAYAPYNLEKPLWVFVGSSVVGSSNKAEKETKSDVAKIIDFFAHFLANPAAAKQRIKEILSSNGGNTSLIDKDGNDLFAGAFNPMSANTIEAEAVYQDILSLIFQSPAGGKLSLERLKGEKGEVLLRCGDAAQGFGLINVGNASGLCTHLSDSLGDLITVTAVDFHDGLFDTIRESSSPLNLLIGSRKFVEGWDCWRVSCLGLMHVGASEGAQIIQLFGRGVRLKGHNRSLKRSSKIKGIMPPQHIQEVETLNVFGIDSSYMEEFQKSLKEEGLPGNEQVAYLTIPLNVTYQFNRNLKVLRTKKTKEGRDYDFKKDAPIVTFGDLPSYLFKNKVTSDWYPRIASLQSEELPQAAQGNFHEGVLEARHLILLDWDALYFETEKFKRERSWYNVNITKDGLQKLLKNKDWYQLLIPAQRLEPTTMEEVNTLQQVALELVKRYLDRYYNYQKRAHTEPRLELQSLTANDPNFPLDKEGNFIENYHLSVDQQDTNLLENIKTLAQDFADEKEGLLSAGDLHGCLFGTHLFSPLLHTKNGKIKISPVALNESEYQFVEDLLKWTTENQSTLNEENTELFLLRNLSRGKGVGFFEASNFHPDFILWILKDDQQYISFAEPHGLIHGSGLGDEKIQFAHKIKEIETRLKKSGGDHKIYLNSFLLSWTPHAELKWGVTTEEFEDLHVLDMNSDRDHYIEKMILRSTAAKQIQVPK